MPDTAAEAMGNDPRVDYVEQNVKGTYGTPISGTQWASWNGQYLWFLDRLDELSWANRDSLYNMCPEGRSVMAYVIDFGVWRDHSEFETPTRVVANIDFSDDRSDHNVQFGPDTTNGCHGVFGSLHGTAVASSLGGTHVGSAKPQIVSLKVFSCAGQYNGADFIDALDWINSANNPYRGQPAVINQSSYFGPWDSLFTSYGDAVDRTVRATGVPFFNSADNFATDACQFSPKNKAYTNINHNGTVFVVGATSVNPSNPSDPNDYRYQNWNTDGTARIGPESGSNGGPCVSAYAPGVSIYAATNYSTATSYTTAAGTSLSSPLVAGIAARYIESYRTQHNNVTPTYQQVYDFLLGQATTRIQLEQTAPTYWMCVFEAPGGALTAYSYADDPVICPTNYTRVQMNSATNTSNARMIYWDNGSCP